MGTHLPARSVWWVSISWRYQTKRCDSTICTVLQPTTESMQCCEAYLRSRSACVANFPYSSTNRSFKKLAWTGCLPLGLHLQHCSVPGPWHTAVNYYVTMRFHMGRSSMEWQECSEAELKYWEHETFNFIPDEKNETCLLICRENSSWLPLHKLMFTCHPAQPSHQFTLIDRQAPVQGENTFFSLWKLNRARGRKFEKATVRFSNRVPASFFVRLKGN